VDDARDDLLPFERLGAMIERVAAEPLPRFLAAPVWPAGDYGMIGAEDKAGKSWAMLDLGVSVASGTPWLGLFPVEVPGPVVAFFGEGGRRKVARRAGAVCESRGIDPADLDLHVCLRAPHLSSAAVLELVEAKVAELAPVLVIVDPLYLAVRGANGSDLYAMAGPLGGAQAVAQRHGAALAIAHHWNQTGQGRGAKRLSGAGPSAWGRVLVSVAVVERRTDPATKATTATLDLDLQGDEVAEQTVRIVRRVWADDPDDLASALHYEVRAVETSESRDPRLAELRPAALRVLRALEAVAPSRLTVHGIGNALAIDDTGLECLKRKTISDGLGRLARAGLADKVTPTPGGADEWRATLTAQDPET
jgi:hypothetical protein